MSDNYACWLSPSLLLVIGSFDAAGDGSARLATGDEAVEVSLRAMQLYSAGADQDGGLGRALLTVGAPDVSANLRAAAELRLEDWNGTAVGPAKLTVTDFETALERSLSGLDTDPAETILEFVSAAPAAHELRGRDLALSKRLWALRESLRPALTPVVIDPERSQGGHPDALIAVDDSAFYLIGWLRDAEAPVARFTAVSPEGERVELLERLFRYPRPELEQVYADGPYADLAQAEGFLTYFETARPSYLCQEWIFEMENEAGTAIEMRALPVQNPATAQDVLLRSVPGSLLPDDELMAKHTAPALSRLQERARGVVRAKGVIDYGSPPVSPAVSIIVPLYRRLDLLEYQLSQFVHHPEISSAELIYVLDSPELDKDLAAQASQLFRLYEVPFRVVTMERHAGFGPANNTAAALARGRLLLLLNSDVLPDAQGWLGAMQTFYDSVEGIGALGPKLLFEDDSLQHAGMYFDVWHEGRSAGQWTTFHYFKGLNRDLPVANVSRPVPAVTGACLMIEKELFLDVGGLPEIYILGDYEDADLCIRLIEAGRENWYLPDVELYHLEGQSYDESDRSLTNTTNRWLLNQRWGKRIEAIMARYPS
jgi:GT2 family glycosyltransferase